MEFAFVLPARVVESTELNLPAPVVQYVVRSGGCLPSSRYHMALLDQSSKVRLPAIHLIDIFGSPCSHFGLFDLLSLLSQVR